MTTQELYDALLGIEDLHSVPQLHDDILVWNLYKDAHILAYCQNGDTSISVESNSLFRGTLYHCHPREEDMPRELYAFGKKGNILVIKKTHLTTQLFYRGPSREYPLGDQRNWYLGKKKWDSGQLVYLEQRSL